MYNALILISLLPLVGPDAGQHVAAMPRPTPFISEMMVVARPDPGDETPSLPVRTVVAYTPDAGPRPAAPVFTPPAPALPQPGTLQAAGQQPTVAPAPLVEAAPVVPAATPAATASVVTTHDADSIHVGGWLIVPQRNKVPLSAPFQSLLMELRTEQRDADGNIVTGPDGRPVIVPLREGMTVFKDQVLGTFDNRELIHALDKAEAQLEVAIAEREKKIEIKHAALAARVAETEANMLQATNQLYEGAITRLEILKAGLAWEQAKAQHELQDYTIKEVKTKEAIVYDREVEAAKVRIEMRKLIAPIGGMIVSIETAEGAWHREGDKVLEIMQLDTLRSICKVSAQYTPAMVDGRDVTVYVKGSDEEFRGKVVFANPQILPGNVFDVYVEVQNRPQGKYWRLQPGHEITAVIHLK